jgi:NADPH2:quinone reductase
MEEIHSGLGQFLKDGSIHPVVGRELPLAEAAQAHRDVMESRAYGKIVLIP